MVLAGDGQFVEAHAVHDPGGLMPQRRERFRHRAGPVGGKHAGQLPPHACRIGERAQQVEDRAGAEFDPRAGGVAHRRVMARGEQEDAAGLRQDRWAGDSIGASTLTPSAVSTSAPPVRDESARLPCFATGTPQPATTKVTAEDTFSVPAPSPPGAADIDGAGRVPRSPSSGRASPAPRR